MTEVKQRNGKGTQNRFRRLYETLLPESLRKHCREWPASKTESEIELLIQENSKPQDLIDQSGCGFIVKQGLTTIHKDSAAYTASTSSLTNGA